MRPPVQPDGTPGASGAAGAPGKQFPPLRRRLFLAFAVTVVVSIGVTFAVGVVLTRRAVQRANANDLNHQSELLAESQRDQLVPFAHLGPLKPFLERQREQIRVFPLGRPTPYLPDAQRAKVRAGEAVTGTVAIGGKRYRYAARSVHTKGFVLLRPTSLETEGWGSYLRALLIAGAVGAILAGLGSLLVAGWISRPLRRVAEASRSLAAGISPEPVPLEVSAELALLASTFNDMAAQLNQAREAERNFLLSVSHELKTPLAAIQGYAEGLEDGVFTSEEAAVTIREEARRLERLVRDLLDISRMNRREFVVHREPIDLADLAREVARRYDTEARALGVDLAVTAEPAPAIGDPDRALQVASNLVENALRSTPAGGSVHVRTSTGVFVVEDTGVGLAAEDLPHTFERFYLHDRNPDGQRRIGSGLGLAIVKELTERMDGTVTVTSELGRGTTFIVRLPTDAGTRSGELAPAVTAPS